MKKRAFLFVDVDGYCASGVNQRLVISARAEGFRARELGWEVYTESLHAAGSIYFRDVNVLGALRETDSSVGHTFKLHGLPINPDENTFAAKDKKPIVVCASRLLEVLQLLHRAVATNTDCDVVFVHKGGNEGRWISSVVPGVITIDLEHYGCPRVDELWKAMQQPPAEDGCEFHTMGRRRRVIHCPQLEIRLLVGWVANIEESGLLGASTAPVGPHKPELSVRTTIQLNDPPQ